MYKILFSQTAEKQFRVLERGIQERVSLVLERISIRPYDFVRKLAGFPYFRLRVGDYRLILDIKNDQLAIIVMEIGHRKNIYKRFE